MDTNELWNKFLDNLKDLVEIVPFETWFKNIEIISNLNSCIFLLNVVSLHKKG